MFKKRIEHPEDVQTVQQQEKEVVYTGRRYDQPIVMNYVKAMKYFGVLVALFYIPATIYTNTFNKFNSYEFGFASFLMIYSLLKILMLDGFIPIKNIKSSVFNKSMFSIWGLLGFVSLYKLTLQGILVFLEFAIDGYLRLPFNFNFSFNVALMTVMALIPTMFTLVLLIFGKGEKIKNLPRYMDSVEYLEPSVDVVDNDDKIERKSKIIEVDNKVEDLSALNAFVAKMNKKTVSKDVETKDSYVAPTSNDDGNVVRSVKIQKTQKNNNKSHDDGVVRRKKKI